MAPIGVASFQLDESRGRALDLLEDLARAARREAVRFVLWEVELSGRLVLGGRRWKP